MAGMIELTDRDFQIAFKNMFKDLKITMNIIKRQKL